MRFGKSWGWPPRFLLVFHADRGVFRDHILVVDRVLKLILHEVGVFAVVAIEPAQNLYRDKLLAAEEELGGKVPFANRQGDPGPAMVGKFCDQFVDHLASDPDLSELGAHPEVEQMEPGAVEFIDHEPDHPFFVLSDHADAIALAKGLEEILLGPWVIKAAAFDGEHFGHVAPDHPADMQFDLFFGPGFHSGSPNREGHSPSRTPSMASALQGSRSA